MKKREYTLTGLSAVLFANIIWGLADVGIGIVGRGQLVTAIMGIFGGLFLLIIQIITRQKFSWKDFLNAFPIGFQRSLVWGGLFYAFQNGNPAVASTILSYSLVVAIVFFGPLLGEKVTLRIILIALIGVMGVVLIANESFRELTVSSGTIVALVLLPVSAAGTFLLRKLQQKVPARTAPTYYFLWVGIIVTPVALLFHPHYEFSRYEILILVVAVLAGAGGHFFYSISQQHTTFQFDAIISTVHAPSTALFSLWLMGSMLALHQWIGLLIVVSTVAYISVASKQQDVHEIAEELTADL